LKADGTVWCVIGDSYAGGGGGNYSKSVKQTAHGEHLTNIRNRADWLESVDLKPKDLIGIPWMLAFALRADGWYLRQDIIWSKPNPMPESVTDRCTKSHEYVFLLSKSAKYWYDVDAIAESARWERWGAQTENKKHVGTAGHLGGKTIAELPIKDKKNRRSVWSVATNPYPEAHFATFPPALIEPCVLAGCPSGGVVLDPFGGSGTTAQVANKFGRKAVLIELNPEYCELIMKRNCQKTLFAGAEVAA